MQPQQIIRRNKTKREVQSFISISFCCEDLKRNNIYVDIPWQQTSVGLLLPAGNAGPANCSEANTRHASSTANRGALIFFSSFVTSWTSIRLSEHQLAHTQFHLWAHITYPLLLKSFEGTYMLQYKNILNQRLKGFRYSTYNGDHNSHGRESFKGRFQSFETNIKLPL